MRQIVLDTETTGLDPKQGHRLIEIGAVELVNRRLTGECYHVYLNPQREVDAGAFRVHGLSNEFLSDKPLFAGVVDAFLDFVDGAELIIHNAPFDLGFINHELKLHQHVAYPIDGKCQICDTLPLAREKHPRQKNNLDALCKRYDIDNRHRDLHGALLDAQLLARVYLAMTSGQGGLFGEVTSDSQPGHESAPSINLDSLARSATPVVEASAEELSAHRSMMSKLFDSSEDRDW